MKTEVIEEKIDYNDYFIYSLAGGVYQLYKAVIKEGVKLSPEHMRAIKEMRDALNDIIVEDMY
jgi:hypothetical protein